MNTVKHFRTMSMHGSRSCSEDFGQGSKKGGSLKLKLQQKFIRRKCLAISTVTPHGDDQKPSSAIQRASLACSSRQNTRFHVATYYVHHASGPMDILGEGPSSK